MTIRIDAENGKRADLSTRKACSKFSGLKMHRESWMWLNRPPMIPGGIIVNVPETEDEIVEDIFNLLALVIFSLSGF